MTEGTISEKEVTEKVKTESNNVKCSFCGNDAHCGECEKTPANLSKFEHMCYDCYQKMGGQIPENVRDKTHLAVSPEQMSEIYDRFMSDVIGRTFNDIWGAEKKKLREMSKQEIAQAMFFEDARFMHQFMQKMGAEKKE